MLTCIYACIQIVYINEHNIQCDSGGIGDDDGGGGGDVVLYESVMCRENIDGIYIVCYHFEENSLWRHIAAC